MYQGNHKAKIHIGKKALGLDEEDYQAFLYGLTGKTSSKDMTLQQQLLVIREMAKRGAFKTKPLTGQQRACVAKWYELRRLGEVNSKDKSSLNRYCKNHFKKWNICDLDRAETDKLFNMLEGWIQKAREARGLVKVTVVRG